MFLGERENLFVMRAAVALCAIPAADVLARASVLDDIADYKRDDREHYRADDYRAAVICEKLKHNDTPLTR